MSKRLQVITLMLLYLIFCSAFFGAVFTAYKTGDVFMVNFGFVCLMIAQIFAGVLVYIVRKTDHE